MKNINMPRSIIEESGRHHFATFTTFLSRWLVDVQVVAMANAWGLGSIMLPFIVVRLPSNARIHKSTYLSAFIGYNIGPFGARFHKNLNDAMQRFANEIQEPPAELFVEEHESPNDKIQIGYDFYTRDEVRMIELDLGRPEPMSFEEISEMLEDYVGQVELIAVSVRNSPPPLILPLVVGRIFSTTEKTDERFIVALLSSNLGPLEATFFCSLDEAMLAFSRNIGACELTMADQQGEVEEEDMWAERRAWALPLWFFP